ncbi:MAG: AraC family transcriptional regulator [Bacteroides sp.]|nr:AraC family transcriptional regulator [Bacteroides sp.]
MKENIPLYKFYKHKYGEELLVDMLDLEQIKPGLIRTPVHRESFYCIIFITGGEETVTVNGHSRMVKSGDVVCSIPGEVWEWQPGTKLEGFVIIFEEDFLLSFFNDLHFLSRFHYLRSDRPSPFLVPDSDLWKRFMQQIESMKQEMEFSLAKDPHILRALLYGTLILLDRAECVAERTIKTPGNTANRHIGRFVELVAGNCHREHNVEYYADKLCITSNYLNKTVKEFFGISAKQYIQQKIFEESKRLLEYTFLNIAEISDELNFNTDSYFVRFFRKHAGISPLQYREKHHQSAKVKLLSR